MKDKKNTEKYESFSFKFKNLLKITYVNNNH